MPKAEHATVAAPTRRRRAPAVVAAAVVAAVAVVVAAAVVVTAAAATPGNAAAHTAQQRRPPAAVGAVAGGYWTPSGANSVDRQYARLARIGVRHTREGFDWNNIQPAPGQWDWSFADAMMTAAARHEVRVAPIFGYSALWASAWPRGARPQMHPPSDYDAYTRYVVETFRRYGAGGRFWDEHPELDPKPITSAEIWNEPYGWWFWGQPSPTRYADLVERTARALDAAGFGRVRIVMHAALRTYPKHGDLPRPWIPAIYAARPALRHLVDVVAVHPYPCSNLDSPLSSNRSPGCPTTRDAIEGVRQALLAAGAPTPMWVTEIGWAVCPGVCPNLDGRVGVSEATQARHVKDMIRLARSYPYIRRLYVYSVKPGEPYGLVRADNSPRPAWHELAAAN